MPEQLKNHVNDPSTETRNAPSDADQRLAQLSSLLNSLDESQGRATVDREPQPSPTQPIRPAPVTAPPVDQPRTQQAPAHQPPGQARNTRQQDNRLVQVRLGMATSLFSSMRARHPATADHCLRVALGCSSWTVKMGVADQLRDAIEVAALLHDVGKIGVPDRVLLKPDRLNDDEIARMERHRVVALEILSGCCASPEVPEIVYYSGARFDGSRAGFDRCGADIPLGARVVAIVDAFDSMTTDHVYRRAMSREHALAELFEHAGSQFDPDLVREFCLVSEDPTWHASVARRWLRELMPQQSNAQWQQNSTMFLASGTTTGNNPFHAKLLDCMHDAVIFVDDQLNISMWNRAAERMTGIPSEGVVQKQWTPGLVELGEENDVPIDNDECPIALALGSGVQTMRRLTLNGRSGKRVLADVQILPVAGTNGSVQGVALLLHDASSQATLEERIQTLHERATQDPLTKVANRAEFDRALEVFIPTHLEEGLPCSLIICDLDHFKSINDNHGHQAGDEALVSFAALLRQHGRAGDVAARYGGEEFVLLCADCGNAAATRRAEVVRQQLSEIAQPMLGGRRITASFGVTEVQPGDTPETMLRRADRALLQAKENGRNMVVQLGGGIQATESNGGWLKWLKGAKPEQLLQRTLVTAVPLKIAIEKLRGFVADHGADVASIEEDFVSLRLTGHGLPNLRRRHDRPVPFIVELRFEEGRPTSEPDHPSDLRTLIQVTIRPKRNRDRRKQDTAERARQVVASLKSYLMAHEQAIDDDEPEDNGPRTKLMLSSLLGR